MTNSEHLLLQFRKQGAAPALSFGGLGPDTVSYEKLGFHTAVMCGRLRRAGVVSGGVYGVVADDPLLHVVATLALEWLGAASVSLVTRGQLDAIKLTTIFTDRELERPGSPIVPLTTDWLTPDFDLPPPPLPHANAPDDLCRIAFTSGSTGKPKPIALTHAMLAERTSNQNLAFGELFMRSTPRLSWIGISTMFGYRILIRTLCEGGLYCFLDPNIPRTVRRMALYKVQALMGSPFQLEPFAAYGEAHPGSFPDLQVVVSIGARLSQTLTDRLRRFVCPNLLLSYGSAELGVAAAASADKVDLSRGQVGYVVPNVQLEVVDSRGRRLTGKAGRVRIGNEHGPRGYYGEAAGKSANFKGRWFYPGDLATLSAEGMLSISGRQDNVVNLGGVKTTLDAIETNLVGAPAVAEIAVVSTPDAQGINRLSAFVVPREDWSEPKFWAYCDTAIGDIPRPFKIALLKELPRSASGKVERDCLLSLLQAPA
jgi:acyl-coenzyme A synthetase/AMP-(fatty) acid ligase